MKRILLTIGAGALALAGTAIAGDEKGDGHKKMSVEEKFAKVDTNEDGVITEAEFTAQGERATAEKFAKMAGDDGELTLDEVKAHYKKKKEHHKDKMHKEHKDKSE